jgi:ubiquinone/menaquinone biosynthesis C-methylase UbiE
MSHRRIDYDRMASIYDSGRALPLEWLDAWRIELAPYFLPAPRAVLDLGSGTGLWAEVFATWFSAAIVAIEPSDAMRRAAADKGLHSGIVMAGGTAERIPLRDESCDCAWLSTVLHHIDDLPACTRELRRVLRPEGVALVRNSFGDRLGGINWLDYFPAARALASRRWPTIDATVSAFRTEGFAVEAIRSIPEVVADHLGAYYDRIRVRANSTLSLISDREFTLGIERLREAATRQTDLRRVVDQRGLLILRRRE